VFLAHVGSYLPCEKAIIGLTDRIFTRILTVESCSLPQSSFTIDMAQVSHMLRHATPRSLLLIDEFGTLLCI
jgi:DNA mismatch repair protein MSH5